MARRMGARPSQSRLADSGADMAMVNAMDQPTLLSSWNRKYMTQVLWPL
jgi:hypothetical protein